MTTSVLAPLDFTAPTKVARKTYRKQILRKGEIDYPLPDGTTKRVVFDDAYLDAVNLAHQQGAYDDVPFILAGADNAHTMDPTRFHGWIRGMERTADGIDAVIELSDEAVAIVERTGGRLGVSPRIKAVRHVDGRTYPAAINHVLGTLDPRMQGPTLGLTPWEAVDLSTSGDDVLDLSGATYREDRTMPRTINLDDLDPADADALVSYAALQGIDLSEPDVESPADPDDDDTPATDPVPDDEDDEDPDEDADDDPGAGDPDDVISDADLEALIDGELEALGLRAPADVSLSTPDDDTAPPALSETGVLRYQLASRDYVAAGVPPAVVDLAAPILALGLDDMLDLSTPDGAPIDVRAIVSDMLDAMKGTVDLSTEAGHGLETDPDAEQDPTTAAWLEHIDKNL